MLDDLADRFVAREQTFSEHPAGKSAVIALEDARVIHRLEHRLIGPSVGDVKLVLAHAAFPFVLISKWSAIGLSACSVSQRSSSATETTRERPRRTQASSWSTCSRK